MIDPNRITIIGVGLIGGSVGLAARRAYPAAHVVGVDRHGDDRKPIELGAVHEMAGDAKAAVRSADLVVVCVPIGQMPAVLSSIAPHVRPTAIVTDVCSTKRSVVAAAPKAMRFVGSHPMAGGDKSGVAAARADLLTDAACIVTRGEDADADYSVVRFWQRLRMRVYMMFPADHDAVVADVSHLTHVTAAALMSVQADATLTLAGPGFVDTTRVAGGDPNLWTEILLDNRDRVADSVERMGAELGKLAALLRAGDETALRSWLSTAARRRVDLQAGRSTVQ